MIVYRKRMKCETRSHMMRARRLAGQQRPGRQREQIEQLELAVFKSGPRCSPGQVGENDRAICEKCHMSDLSFRARVFFSFPSLGLASWLAG